MKHVLLLLALSTLLLSCGSTSKTATTTTMKKNADKETLETIKNAEKQASTNPTSTAQEDILIGKQNKKALTEAPHAEWFVENYEDYNINPEIKPMIKPLLENVSIKVFMGTWCSDSRREVPTFYKILDAANFNYDHLELITVSREKTTPEGYEKGLDIKRVPTFIFYKDGKEIGRYVEFAVTTLEDDMLSILSGGNYKHSYYEGN